MRRLFLRSFALALATFAVLFGSEFFLEWRRAGYPSIADMSWAGVNNAKLVDILSPMARAYNNVLAMLIATIGLAIPLTANMHTPKLIDMFLKDRINRWVLSLITIGAAHTLWVDYIIGPRFAPTWAVAVTIYFALIGWAILIPYFFYVVRFVDPSRLIVRLRDNARHLVEAAANRKMDPEVAKNELLVRVGQIGTIIIKSLDRNDRDVAHEGAWAIKGLLDHYQPLKARMPKEWFKVDRADFVGLSDDALEMLSENRTWYEMKCLLQLELGYLRALSAAHDTVSAFSDATRVIGDRALANRDDQALRLTIRFFNSYLREGIKTRNMRAVYDVFHQYRKLGRDLVDRPDLLRDLGRTFTYYAIMSRRYGMLFTPQLVIFDLGYVVRRAYERASPAAGDLLGACLALPHRTGDDVHSLAVKAKLILGGFFLEIKHTAEAERVRLNLADVAIDEVLRAEVDLLSAERAFFEITDRQLNIEYVPPERRAPLKRFCAALITSEPVNAAPEGVDGAAKDEPPTEIAPAASAGNRIV
jgi:hypothetical protein